MSTISNQTITGSSIKPAYLLRESVGILQAIRWRYAPADKNTELYEWSREWIEETEQHMSEQASALICTSGSRASFGDIKRDIVLVSVVLFE